MKKRKLYPKLIAACLCTTLLYGCSNNLEDLNNVNNNNQNQQVISDINIENGELVTYEGNDFYSDWKDENPNYIELNGTVADSIGTGVEMSGDTITITKAGVYVLSGQLNNGQIVINEQDKGVVKLVLNGVDIHSEKSAPIYVKKAGKTIISLEEGTENTLSDGENYIFEDEATDEPNATLYSKDDLTINGTGKLTVQANYNNGISSKDDLKITGGQIYIESADDGLMGRDLVAVKEGEITIKSAGDGIKSTNDEDETQGIIVLEGGIFNIEAAADGIQGETAVYITDGDFTIITGGGSVNAPEKVSTLGMRNQMGNWGNNNEVTSEEETESQSNKGIKAGTLIAIEGGTFNLDTLDDAIHSNDSITMADGDLIINAGDDGIHADTSIVINGGNINIEKSYEGIESADITIAGGNIYVTASDDGVNVAGGNDGSSMNGRPGQNNFNLTEDNKLAINGGYMVVNASGDGLDANGSIYMTGGTVIVKGPTNSGNGALDYDRVFEISGGTLITTGSMGMAQAPSETSSQHSIVMNFSNTQEAHSLVHLQDSEGNTIITFAPEKAYQNIIISSPELIKDESYVLYSGGTVTGNESNGLYTDGDYQNGTKIVDFTISDILTWLSETGVTTGAQQRGFGGMGRQGGGFQNQEGVPVQGEMPIQGEMPVRGEMPIQRERVPNQEIPNEN